MRFVGHVGLGFFDSLDILFSTQTTVGYWIPRYTLKPKHDGNCKVKSRCQVQDVHDQSSEESAFLEPKWQIDKDAGRVHGFQGFRLKGP